MTANRRESNTALTGDLRWLSESIAAKRKWCKQATAGLSFVPAHGTAASSFSAETTVYFSPHGGATEAIVRELGNAQHRIMGQAYSFTLAPIAKALLDAHKRGVKIITEDSRLRVARGGILRFPTLDPPRAPKLAKVILVLIFNIRCFR